MACSGGWRPTEAILQRSPQPLPTSTVVSAGPSWLRPYRRSLRATPPRPHPAPPLHLTHPRLTPPPPPPPPTPPARHQAGGGNNENIRGAAPPPTTAFRR